MALAEGPVQLARYLGILAVVAAVIFGAAALDGDRARGLCDVVRQETGAFDGGRLTESTGNGFVRCEWEAAGKAVLAHVLAFDSDEDAQAWVNNDQYRRSDSPSLGIGDVSFSSAISREIVTAVAASGSFVVSSDAIRIGHAGPMVAQRLLQRVTDALATGWRPWEEGEQPGLFFEL